MNLILFLKSDCELKCKSNTTQFNLKLCKITLHVTVIHNFRAYDLCWDVDIHRLLWSRSILFINARVYVDFGLVVLPLSTRMNEKISRYNLKIQLVCCTSYQEGHGIRMMWILLLQLVNHISSFGMSEQWSMYYP